MDRIYLVTGAAGHLGSTIVRTLVAQDQKVRALVLPTDKLAEKLPSEVECIKGDVRDIESLQPFFEPAPELEKVVIHTAGIVTIASSYNQLVYDVNVTGTKNILDQSLIHGARKMIHVSSVHALPDKPANEVRSEISHYNPDEVNGLYSRTKSEASALALNAAEEGLDVSIVLPSGISGPYDSGRGHMTQLLVDYCKGRLTAGIHGGYDFVDVRDVADGILACVDRGRKGESYILSNRYFSIPELLEIFHQVTGRKPVKTFLPTWFAKVTAPLAELYYKVLKQPPLYTPYSIEVLTENSNFSHEKASRELGYTTRPMEETVRDSLTWLEQIGRI